MKKEEDPLQRFLEEIPKELHTITRTLALVSQRVEFDQREPTGMKRRDWRLELTVWQIVLHQPITVTSNDFRLPIEVKAFDRVGAATKMPVDTIVTGWIQMVRAQGELKLGALTQIRVRTDDLAPRLWIGKEMQELGALCGVKLTEDEEALAHAA